MPLPDELLDTARRLLDLDGIEPRQATIRRSVSTAYYALFHLLISEALENWSRPEFRPILGRIFEHGTMRSVSERMASDLSRKLKVFDIFRRAATPKNCECFHPLATKTD
jgi:hypothetical protein